MSDTTKQHWIETGFGRFDWRQNGDVYNEEGHLVFHVRGGVEISELVVTACLESYFDGSRHGFKEGQLNKLHEIQAALGL